MESETFLAQGPGTPAAFSTAVKPMKNIPAHVEGGRISFESIAARLSLDKEAEEDQEWSPATSSSSKMATITTTTETIGATELTSGTPTTISASHVSSEFTHQEMEREEDRKKRDDHDDQWLSGLIEDEQEPTIMFEADEFSLFQPTHLMTYMNDSNLGRESSERNVNETFDKEGLASIYLKPSSPLTDEEEEEEVTVEEGNINPFDSDGEVQSLGDIDIGVQSKDAFLADLSKEGKLTAQADNESCTEQLNFTQPAASCSHISENSQQLSVTSFFEKKSYPLGNLSTDHPPPPEMRPQFADQQVLLSPPGVDLVEEKPLRSGPQPSSLSPVIRESFVPADLTIPALQLTTNERSGVSSQTTLSPSNLPSMYLHPNNDTTLYFNTVLVSPLPSQVLSDSQTTAPTPTLARLTNLWMSEDETIHNGSNSDQLAPARVNSTPPVMTSIAGSSNTTPLVTVSSVLEASPRSVPTSVIPTSFSSSYHTPMYFTSPTVSTHYQSPLPAAVSPSSLGKVGENHTVVTSSVTPPTCTSVSSESTSPFMHDGSAGSTRLVESNRQEDDTSLEPTVIPSPSESTSNTTLTSQLLPPANNEDSFISEQSSNSFNSASGYFAGVSTFSHSAISTHDRKDKTTQPSVSVSLSQHSPAAPTHSPSTYSSLLSSLPSSSMSTVASTHLSALIAQTTTTRHHVSSPANKHSSTPPHLPPTEQIHLSSPSISSHNKDDSDTSKSQVEGSGDDLDTSSSSVSSSLSSVDRKCLPSVSALLTVPTSTGQVTGKSDVTIEAPQCVMLGEVCCVGTSETCHLAVKNKHTSRWTQCNIVVQQVLKDGHVDPDDSILSHHSTCFIGPCMTEKIKLTFSPRISGSYEITLLLSPCLVTDPTAGSGSAAVSVVFKALAEEPRVQVLTGFEGGNILNYGTVLAGKVVLLPLYLVNHSATAVPIKLSLATTSPAWFCYSFPDPSERLLSQSTTPSKRQVGSTALKLCLPPKDLQMEDPDIHTVMVQFSAPQKTLDDALSAGPPMQHNARLDVFIDGIHSNQSISRVELSALVGVVRLHAYRDMQFISLSSEMGHTASQVVPLKNAGNIDIVVQFKVNVDGFLARPDRLHLQPTERAEVLIEFTPTAGSSEIVDGSMLLHVTPEGPMYTIKLRGTVLQPAPNLAVSSVATIPVVSPQCFSPPPPPYCSGGTNPNVLDVQSILFHDTAVGNRSEKVLRVHNPYNAVLTWQMVPVSPSFLKTMDNTAGELYKTSQVVFTAQGSGKLQPAETKEIIIGFQPYYAGYNYTQMWNLQVVGNGIDKKSYRISLGGKGLRSSHHMGSSSLPAAFSAASHLPSAVRGGLTSLGVPPIYTQTQLRSPPLGLVPPIASSTESRRINLSPATAVRHADTSSHNKQAVYLSNDEVTFPVTSVGDRASLKIRVCNKENATLTFEVLKPNPPFGIAHDTFTLRSRQYARLPVYFCPTHPNQSYREILAIKTKSGHQMFAILKGRST